MGRRRHKRKNSHVVIVTSDAVDASTRQFRVRPWIVQTLVFLLCIIIGAAIGFVIFEKDNFVANSTQDTQQEELITALQEENADLRSQVADLNSTVQILSETVVQKTESEGILSELLASQSIPTEFPVTGATNIEASTEGDPMCIFTATEGAMVVATANGTVSAVNDDAEYGHNVWVDHGNGYITIYRNQGKVKVKQGETVFQGSTLFLIEDANDKLGYQVIKDGAYTDPMDMLRISG